jgi:hypothetical protein
MEMSSWGGGFLATTAGMLNGTSHLFRPLSAPLWAGPYSLFGAQPLPWHLLMAALTAAGAWAFFGVLRGLGAPTAQAALASLLYMAFPNKDSTLFWPAVSLLQSASILLLMLSYGRHLRYIKEGGAAKAWQSGALLALGLCAYEQAFFLLPLWLLAPADDAEQRRRRKTGALAALGGLTCYALYRFGVAPRLAPHHKTMRLSPWHFPFVYYMALRSVLDPRWLWYLVQLAWKGLSWAPAAMLLSAVLPWAASRLLPRSDGARGAARHLMAWGATLWLLAHLPFVVTDYAPAAYDHMNRLCQLPALGLAALACGAALALPARGWILIAAASVSLALSPVLAEVWAESYRRQLEVRDAVNKILPSWPADKPLLLRLPEFYVERKAPVFLAQYDISSAIRLWTGDKRRLAYIEGTMERPENAWVLLDMTAKR